jgi:hypothetical protein
MTKQLLFCTVLFVTAPLFSGAQDARDLGDGFYYQASQGWQKLEPILLAGGGAKHVGKMFVPGLTPQFVWTFRRAVAPIQISERRPTFCISRAIHRI